jgi:structural maintenance of chromosome 4
MAASTDTLRAKVTASRQKTDEAKASLAANKSENAVLSTLTRLREQGRVKGFHVGQSG